MSALQTLKDHLVTAVATAAVLGGGGSIIANKIDIGRHDERISAIENLADELDETQDELRDTRVAIEALKHPKE